METLSDEYFSNIHMWEDDMIDTCNYTWELQNVYNVNKDDFTLRHLYNGCNNSRDETWHAVRMLNDWQHEMMMAHTLISMLEMVLSELVSSVHSAILLSTGKIFIYWVWFQENTISTSLLVYLAKTMSNSDR